LELMSLMVGLWLNLAELVQESVIWKIWKYYLVGNSKVLDQNQHLQVLHIPPILFGRELKITF